MNVSKAYNGALEVTEVAKDTKKDSEDRPSSKNFIENESPEEKKKICNFFRKRK